MAAALGGALSCYGRKIIGSQNTTQRSKASQGDVNRKYDTACRGPRERLQQSAAPNFWKSLLVANLARVVYIDAHGLVLAR